VTFLLNFIDELRRRDRGTDEHNESCYGAQRRDRWTDGYCVNGCRLSVLLLVLR